MKFQIPKFIAIEQPSGEDEFIRNSGTKPFWFRIVVNNKSQQNLAIALRVFGYGDQIRAIVDYRGNRTDYNLYQSLKNPNYFYPGGKVLLSPGQNSIYIHFKSAWGKYPFSFDITDEKSTQDDKITFLNSRFGIILTLFAFLFLIIFQMLYVLLQLYYHKKREYLEYFFYLFCIAIYFFVRLDLNSNSNLLSTININLAPLLNEVMLILPYTFYLRFSRYFLSMESRFPAINKQIKKVEWINTIFILPLLIFHFLGWSDIVITASVIFVFTLFIYTLWLIRFFYLRRNPVILFLLAGSLCAATGHALAMSFNLFPYLDELFHLPPFYSTIAGLIFEIFFFNTGLGYKAMYEQEQKLKAQVIINQQLDANQKIQNKLHGMRDKIANDLHDDVGSTLSSIGLYSDVALKSLEEENSQVNVKSILQKISDSAQRTMQSMNEIVWAIHTKNDHGEGLLLRIKNTAAERLSHTGIRFSMNTIGAMDTIQFSMEARRNITLLFKEAINNAAKYSQAENIQCDVIMKDGNLLIHINDDGIGFENNVADKGNGMNSMLARVNALNGTFSIHTSPGNGTKITMEFLIEEISMDNSG
ncbi:MAG: sensor histidine kinase [Bacteroidetes bacterium]|nr:sensor histidine kinase [Bacteroidota bacterium]